MGDHGMTGILYASFQVHDQMQIRRSLTGLNLGPMQCD
jgi:hypothetical protein